MKTTFILFFALLLGFTSSATAQMRGDISSPFDYQGQVVNATITPIQTKLTQFFNRVEMSQSYSMSFASFGGSYQNVNAYTNTLQFAVNDRLNFRADVSLVHSPFGGNNALGNNFSQPRIMLSNAEMNYRIGEKSFISIQYRQSPYANNFGMSPFGSPFGNSFSGSATTGSRRTNNFPY